MVNNIFESVDILGAIIKSWIDIFVYFWPFLSLIIIPVLTWRVIKFVVKSWAYKEARMSGFGHRRAKKESAKAGLFVDLISTSSDLVGTVKSDK